MDVFDAIRERRSIKPLSMKPDPVPRALLESLLEAANWAPSHRHTEPWRFVVFEGEARRALAEAVIVTMAPPGAPPLAADDPRRAATIEKFLRPPCTIAIVCAPAPLPKVDPEEELASTAMAVQNLHLAARAHGLGGFWSSGSKATDPRTAAFLGLEPPARCLGFFFVGWPAEAWPRGERRPWQDKVSWRA